MQGIIGACRIIDHIIWQTEFSDVDSNLTIESIDDLPAGNVQLAAKYIGKGRSDFIMFIALFVFHRPYHQCVIQISTLAMPLLR